MHIINIKDESPQNIIEQASLVLSQGGIVIYPTETCYGVGVDASNSSAVEKLLQYKRKRQNKPLSIIVSDQKMAEDYVFLNETAKNIYCNFLPGPITVVSSGKQKLAPLVESPQKTQGIRLPSYPLILDIVKKFGRPITATSANASYKKTPYQIQDILQNISEKQKGLIDLILDAGELPKRKPSVVIDTTMENIQILREGDLDIEKYQTFLSSKEEETQELAKLIYEAVSPYLQTKLIVLKLQGDLGTGKTFFTRSFAQNLGIRENVKSPTFILCHEYPIKDAGTLYHLDTYRMYEANEMEDLGINRLFQPQNVIVIEWADRVSQYIEPYLKEAVVIDMRLKHMPEKDTREIKYKIKL